MSDSTNSDSTIFKWACLLFAIVAAMTFGWAMNDIRLGVDDAVATLNENLPEILEKTKDSAATLAQVSEDIEQLRDLAGVQGEARDASLVGYADSALDLIETIEGRIGIEKTFGKSLKDDVSCAEWVVAARKEALWLTFRAKSRAELLERLSANKFGSPWLIQLPETKPIPLSDWLRENHPESAELPSMSPTEEDEVSEDADVTKVP